MTASAPVPAAPRQSLAPDIEAVAQLLARVRARRFMRGVSEHDHAEDISSPLVHVSSGAQNRPRRSVRREVA